MPAQANKPLISLVVPFYNEQEAVAPFFARTVPILEAMADLRFEIVCINDGSTDETLRRLIAASARDARVNVIDLTRNFGKEAALTAGIDEAIGDAVIPIDADLQDPPELIPAMVEHWLNGAEVVAAKRTDRDDDTLAKRTAAALYYRAHNALSEIKLLRNVGDYRLMDREVVNALCLLPERRRFMKGLFAWVGYRTVIVEYKREPRSAGRSKFSGWQLWNFALEGITGFSTVPLRCWNYLGALIAVGAFLYAGVVVAKTLLFGNPVAGYSSLISVMLFLGGIELIGIGVIGEYIGRIYYESKGRPVYLVHRRYRGNAQESVTPIGNGAPSPRRNLKLVSTRRRPPARARASGSGH
ncbi:glycosyltransferase family 2 protein [Trinickia violacea]|uniref:Glycosyltransferase family 2 protein n=1 Tax=Trinickia violacea TaxID=2571746 RepID=A0A4P8J2R3_9BURK|nr:glycosyltransferase family 2 protein [Trinickia violacea]QCP52709.1 glycosyltransferase family 2 protein [Trinickia violacea]